MSDISAPLGEAVSLYRSGRLSEAASVLDQAVRRSAGNADAYNLLGLCYFGMRHAGPAIRALEWAASLAPNAADIQHNLGLARLLNDEWEKALVVLRKAVELAPGDETPYVTLGEQLHAHGMYEELVERMAAGIRSLPNSFRLQLLLAWGLASSRDSIGAETAFRRALELNPASANTFATWLQTEGRFDEANEVFERSLALNPRQGLAYYGLRERAESEERTAARVEEMEAVFGDPSVAGGERMYLAYAMGLAYERVGRFGEAMDSYDRANEFAFRLHNEGRPFDPERVRRAHDVTMRAFNGTQRSSAPAGAGPGPRPILIVGMVRSGTTLLDQIISSHPEVGAAGELRFWMEEALAHFPFDRLDAAAIDDLRRRYLQELMRADPTRPFVTDKMPLNFRHLGLIRLAFPNAKIVHIRRSPIDTCLSIYMTYLGAGPDFAYRKENIVFFYREYLRLMDHWRSVIPKEDLIELDYERLVAEPEPSIRNVIQSLGLGWDEACLRHESQRGTVSTPSRWQARQPIYSKSVERWRRYEPCLGVFSQLLADNP